MRKFHLSFDPVEQGHRWPGRHLNLGSGFKVQDARNQGSTGVPACDRDADSFTAEDGRATMFLSSFDPCYTGRC